MILTHAHVQHIVPLSQELPLMEHFTIAQLQFTDEFQ